MNGVAVTSSVYQVHRYLDSPAAPKLEESTSLFAVRTAESGSGPAVIKPGRPSLYQKLIAELDDEIARLMHTLWLTDDFSRDFPSWLEV